MINGVASRTDHPALQLFLGTVVMRRLGAGARSEDIAVTLLLFSPGMAQVCRRLQERHAARARQLHMGKWGRV
jgi:hypothetical protein